MGLIAPDQPDQRQPTDAQPSRMLVFADLRISSQSFLIALNQLGDCICIGQGVWALRTFESVAVVRNRLAAETLLKDRLLIADMTRDRFAGVNLGPEVEERLRQIWRSTKEDQPRREAPRVSL